MELEPQDSFGTGLRAYLGRQTVDEVGADEQPPGAPADPPPAQEPSRPLTQDELEQRTTELAEHEQRFRAHVQAFEAHVAGLARREAELREREAAAEERAQTVVERRPVREALREHAELTLPRILQVFDEAMTATDPTGVPDHGVRLAAVRAMLAEAYAQDGDASVTAAVVDELAEMRHRRVGT